MYPINLTQRSITRDWNRETQCHDESIFEETVYVNPELIEFVRPATDAPNKYLAHVRMHSGWDLFIVESPKLIDALIKRARYDVLLERAIERRYSPDSVQNERNTES